MIINYITRKEENETTLWNEWYQDFLPMVIPSLGNKQPLRGKTIRFYKYGVIQ